MSDISRNDRGALVHGDPALKKLWLNLQINERINQEKQLDVLLEKLITVDVKQLELKKEELKKEILKLQNELHRLTVTGDKQVEENNNG